MCSFAIETFWFVWRFSCYAVFFLVQDLVEKDYSKVKFYRSFDNFESVQIFCCVNDYLVYGKKVIDFKDKRNNRIEKMYNG